MRREPYKALVIGAAGNIGTRLVAHLRAVGHDVVEADIKPGLREGYVVADITQPVDLLPAFDWGPDVVFHLAAAVGRTTCEQAGALAVSTNLMGLGNVLQLCRRARATCVYFSTSEVYGPSDTVHDDAASRPHPNNRYGLSKYLGEQLVEYEVRHTGLRAVTVRPCMIYDERETVGEHRSAMIRFASNLARGRRVTVHAGSARGWLHATDAARAIEAAGYVREYATINLGHPDVVPMQQLAAMMCAELGADPGLVTVESLPPRMTLVKRPTLERQRALLGFEPAVSLAEGVRRVCAVQAWAAARDRAAADGGPRVVDAAEAAYPGSPTAARPAAAASGFA
ncbi:epimerase [Gemmatimonadetes bacterium T265]|nr:epimerase [Gemmatimonadetes bacterium T265]